MKTELAGNGRAFLKNAAIFGGADCSIALLNYHLQSFIYPYLICQCSSCNTIFLRCLKGKKVHLHD
jgi:hypothetical protein